MYEYFKLGLDKVAYYPPAYTGGQQQQEQEHSSGMPWGKLALGGLLGAGAAYGWGKMSPNAPSMIQNFSTGVDNYLVNPLKARFQGMMSSPENEAEGIQNRANQAGFFGQFNGVKHRSQLQGTEFYSPGALEAGAGTAAGVAGAGQLASLGGTAGRWGMKKVAPGAAGRLASTGVGQGLSKGLGFLGKAAPVLGAAATIPDGLQLGDKLNDSLITLKEVLNEISSDF